jgi:hypothetical protein
LTAFVSALSDCDLHPSGWLELAPRRWITKRPIWDRANDCPARIGVGPAREWCRQQHPALRVATAPEYEELHQRALYIAPVTLPTAAMTTAAGVPRPWADQRGRDTPQMARYRAANMRTREWCRLHDDEVKRRLEAAGYGGTQAVANDGKHLDADGDIIGWWTAAAPSTEKIQNESGRHRAELHFTDYATNVHACFDGEAPPSGARAVAEPAPDPPAADFRAGFIADAYDLSSASLGQRCLAWLGFQFGLDPREVPGPRNNETILSYSRHCRRGGKFLGVAADGSPIWEGGTPLPLAADSDAWCAATASESLRCALLPGERPPHGLRVSVRELVEDARAASTLRPPEWTPAPGALAIEARMGEDPLKGGKGHVRRVVQVEGDRYLGLGGNEADRIVCAWHKLRKPELRGWIDVDAPAPRPPEQLPAEPTPATPAEIAAALRAAWPEGSKAGRVALLAQILHETANGSRIRAHNVGNARAKPGGLHCWTFFQTYEFFPPKQAAAYVNGAKPRTDDVIGLDCEFGATQPDGRQRVNFYPSHIGACFRAFRSLGDGVGDYLAMLRKGFPASWKAVESGDVAAFARALHAEHYFTASPQSYEAALVRLAAQFADV